MLNEATLQMLRQLAHGLCVHFGSNCEVVVHDLSRNQPDSSIVLIENGHVSSRKVGDGPSHIVLEALRADPAKLEDKLSYLTRTHDGRILKSSTIYIRDENGKPVGMARLVGDGIYYLLCDVAVVPDCQGKGIGGELVRRTIAHARQTLADGERCTIALVSAGGKEPFYESLGFSSVPNDRAGHGMQLSVTP